MTCRACNLGKVEVVIDFGSQPIVHQLLASPTENTPTYPFEIGVCGYCGLVQIKNPISSDVLYKNYFTLSSWKNQPHVDRLIWLIQDILGVKKNAPILEVGCNDGSFLQALIESGYENIVGIEPTADAARVAMDRGFDIEYGFFDLKMASTILEQRGRPKLLVSRQVLEHIADLPEFMKGLNKLVRKGDPLLLEIPDSKTNIQSFDFAFWEEHVNYFTENTVRNLLAAHGFEIAFMEQIVFSGNTLVVLAFKIDESTGSWHQLNRGFVEPEIERAKRLGGTWPIFRKSYRDYMEEVLERSGPIGIYGCGARSSTIANFLKLEDFVDCYIDDQTEKQECFLPGNCLKIMRREQIDEKNLAHIVLGVNSENEQKVIESNKLLDRKITFDSILPPSRYLPPFWRELILSPPT